MDAGHSLGHYLGSFTLYTLLAIGMIYGVFWYLKKNPQGLMKLARMTKGKTPLSSLNKQELAIESSLPLEIRKNLYVIRSGQERFLVATSAEGTQFLARLENAPAEPEPETDPGEDLERQPGHPQGDPAQRASSPVLGILGRYLPKTCLAPTLQKE